MTMMHQFQPPARPLGRRGAPAYLRTVMPSSIVPYIVTLPVPAPEDEPPCAHALNSSTAAAIAKRSLITAYPRKDRLRF